MADLPNKSTTVQYVPTGQTFDVEELRTNEISKEDLKEIMIRLYQGMNTSATVVNAKSSGNYQLSEFINNDLYFGATKGKERSVYRKVINIGAVAPGATAVAHGLTIGAAWTFVRIYGCGSKAGAYYPIPNATIDVNVDAANINITNGTALTFTTCTVVLEYLKN